MAKRHVLVVVVLCVEKVFCLLRCSIKCEPTFVLREGHSSGSDSKVTQPILNGVDAFLLGSKYVNDLFRSPMFPVVSGVRMGAVLQLAEEFPCYGSHEVERTHP